MEEQVKNKSNKGLIIIIILMTLVILGLVGYILVDKDIIKIGNQTKVEEKDNKKENKEEIEKPAKEKNIEVTDELKKELRAKIPKIINSEVYLFKQYNGKTFYATDLTEEDKTSDFNEGQGAMGVYHVEEKTESTVNEVYIYDYILLYSQQGECYDFDVNNQCSDSFDYGTNYNRLHLKYDQVNPNDTEITDNTIKKYGQLYKYTFKLSDGKYSYYSTEAVK